MSDTYNAALINKILSDFEKGERENSLNKLQEFLDNNPSDNTARYNLALMQEIMGDIYFAIQNYNKVIDNDRNHWRARFNLCVISIKQKNLSTLFIL